MKARLLGLVANHLIKEQAKWRLGHRRVWDIGGRVWEVWGCLEPNRASVEADNATTQTRGAGKNRVTRYKRLDRTARTDSGCVTPGVCCAFSFIREGLRV